jgi:flagellar FliJ protein
VSDNKFPLQSLLDLTHARQDDAARRLGELLASAEEGANKLALLNRYREEYQQRFLDQAQQGIDKEMWVNYRAFLARLDEAIAQQQQTLAASRQRVSDGQKAWLAQRNKAKAFDTLSQRHRAGLAIAERRAEQKVCDEHGAKASRNDPAAETDREGGPP